MIFWLLTRVTNTHAEAAGSSSGGEQQTSLHSAAQGQLEVSTNVL